MKTLEQTGGVDFPRVGDARPSLALNRAVIVDALRAADAAGADAAEAESRWRQEYPRHHVRLVRAALETPEGASRVSTEGLESLYRRMTFRRRDVESSVPFAMATYRDEALATASVRGTGQRATRLEVPYRGTLLSGDALLRQVDRWELEGIVEPTHGDALRRFTAHPEWLDLSDRTFALLGAGAELGPFQMLAAWGATVAALDVPRPDTWKRLLSLARAGAGTTLVPVRSGPAQDTPDLADRAGADLLTETPEVRTWLAGIRGPLTVGTYAYLDGALHLRVNVAADAVMADLAAARRDVSLAFLPTPTNVFAIPAEAAEQARRRWERRPLAWRVGQGPLRLASRGSLFQPAVRELVTTRDGWRGGIADCLVLEQGPNYALAKRLQHWRAVVSRGQGVRVSANVAPPSATRSVIKNLGLAAAYRGASTFGVEIFAPETANALMAALLVHDLRYDGGLANPATPMRNGLELFMEGANHGGLWRLGYLARSVLTVAAVLGLPGALRSARRG